MAVLVGTGLVFGIIIGGGIEKATNSYDLRAKAVEVGAAEWLVNPKDGTTKFQWKEAK